MTSHGNTNGVIISASIKSEENSLDDGDNCSFFPSSSTSGSIVIAQIAHSPSNSGLYSPNSNKNKERNVSTSSIVSTAFNAAVNKMDFNGKSQRNSLDLYSTSGSLEQSPSSSPLSPIDGHPQDMFCTSTMSGDCSSNTSVDASDAKMGDSSPKRICLVCGDTASGFHYGVASCEACKAFFKRTIQGNIEYTCPASNDCEINKRRRKACQACRFQKCLRMGMLKEGVRLDRVRGGRQKYRRNPESPYQVQNLSPIKKPSIEENKMVAALLTCEPELLFAINTQSNASSLASNQYKTICILSDLVDRELVSTIGWAKQIPGFTELILNDQMRLLQTTWAEILSLSLAFRSHQLHLSNSTGANVSQTKLVFASDFIMDEQLANNCGGDELFTHCIELIKRLDSLKIVKEEYMLMKALILTNADIHLEDSASVYKLRETILCALQECISALRPYNCVNHLSQILLCLPLIRQLDSVVRRYWNNVRREGHVPMNKLFVEMLESNITMR